jgi:hypothetical protein
MQDIFSCIAKESRVMGTASCSTQDRWRGGSSRLLLPLLFGKKKKIASMIIFSRSLLLMMELQKHRLEKLSSRSQWEEKNLGIAKLLLLGDYWIPVMMPQSLWSDIRTIKQALSVDQCPTDANGRVDQCRLFVVRLQGVVEGEGRWIPKGQSNE